MPGKSSAVRARPQNAPSTALTLLVLLAACGSRGGDYAAPIALEGPLAGAGQVVALNSTDGALLAVDPMQGTARAFPLPAGARHLAVTPDGLHALAVTGDAQTQPGLSVVSLAPASLGQERDYALPATADVVHVSPDGAFVFLTVDPSETQAGPGQALVDPNQAVIVDLSTGAAVAVALGTDSPAPQSVVFAPPGQGGAQLVAVLFDKGLAILDLGSPGQVLRVPVRIEGGPDVTPLKALFSSFTGGQGYLYVMAAQSDDVIVVSISTANGLQASINFLAGAQGLADIALPPGPPPPSTVLALYSGSQQALQLDARGRVDLTKTAVLGAPATQLAPAASGLLLAWSPGSPTVFTWNPPEGLVASATLDGPVQGLAVSPSGSFAVASVAATPPELAVLQPGQATNGPTLAVSPLLLAAAPMGTQFDPATGLCYFGEQGEPFVTRVDPVTLSSQSVTLDSAPTGLLLTAAAAVAVQPSPYGQLTSVPTAAFDRTDARIFPDYVLSQEASLVSGP